MKKKYARKALVNGTFRIGTLYEYQDIEKHGEVIGDQHEGKKFHRNNPSDVYDYSKPETVPDFARKFINAPDGMHLTVKNIQMQEVIKSPDLYLYCLSDTLSYRAMEAFESDAVLRIDDVKGFSNALTSCLRKKGNIRSGYTPANCIYIDRATHYSNPNDYHPALIKDPSYKYQNEVRIIWQPRKTPIEPIIITCKSARRYCSLVSDEEFNHITNRS